VMPGAVTPGAPGPGAITPGATGAPLPPELPASTSPRARAVPALAQATMSPPTTMSGSAGELSRDPGRVAQAASTVIVRKPESRRGLIVVALAFAVAAVVAGVVGLGGSLGPVDDEREAADLTGADAAPAIEIRPGAAAGLAGKQPPLDAGVAEVTADNESEVDAGAGEAASLDTTADTTTDTAASSSAADAEAATSKTERTRSRTERSRSRSGSSRTRSGRSRTRSRDSKDGSSGKSDKLRRDEW